MGGSVYWKHKGLFELEQLSEALQDDGTHLNHSIGYPKYSKIYEPQLYLQEKAYTCRQ